MKIEITRMDMSLPSKPLCQWCLSVVPLDQFRVSVRVDPRPRVILFCLSCREREASGELDAYGQPIKRDVTENKPGKRLYKKPNLSIIKS